MDHLNSRLEKETQIPILVGVIDIARNASWVVVVFDEDTVPAFLFLHGYLPLCNNFAQVIDLP